MRCLPATESRCLPMRTHIGAYSAFRSLTITRRSDWNVKNLKFTPTNGVAEYNRRAPQTGLYPGCREALAYFRDAGCRQYLLSATEREMLAGQLAPLDIASFFDDIVGQDDTRAHGKLAAAVEWSKKVRLGAALLIGDSLHDAEVAAAIGADCVLLACGHQSRARLEATGCRVFDTVTDLLHAAEKGEL